MVSLSYLLMRWKEYSQMTNDWRLSTAAAAAASRRAAGNTILRMRGDLRSAQEIVTCLLVNAVVQTGPELVQGVIRNVRRRRVLLRVLQRGSKSSEQANDYLRRNGMYAYASNTYTAGRYRLCCISIDTSNSGNSFSRCIHTPQSTNT